MWTPSYNFIEIAITTDSINTWIDLCLTQQSPMHVFVYVWICIVQFSWIHMFLREVFIYGWDVLNVLVAGEFSWVLEDLLLQQKEILVWDPLFNLWRLLQEFMGLLIRGAVGSVQTRGRFCWRCTSNLICCFAWKRSIQVLLRWLVNLISWKWSSKVLGVLLCLQANLLRIAIPNMFTLDFRIHQIMHEVIAVLLFIHTNANIALN